MAAVAVIDRNGLELTSPDLGSHGGMAILGYKLSIFPVLCCITSFLFYHHEIRYADDRRWGFVVRRHENFSGERRPGLSWVEWFYLWFYVRRGFNPTMCVDDWTMARMSDSENEVRKIC